MNTVAPPEDVVQHFVTRARRLYSLPAVAVRVLELTSQPTVDTQALTECIENDPALTTKILRVVNSSLFGMSQRVSNLKQALTLLGTKPLKMLVLGFSLPTSLPSTASTEVLSRYWRHTLLKATAAREIAENWYQLAGDEPFIGGLLQDLGLLVLIQDLGESYENFLLGVWEDGIDLPTEQTKVIGFDHKLLTAKLLDDWKLPEQLVRAIAHTYDVERLAAVKPEEPLPQVLHLADLVASFLMDHRPPLLDVLLQVGQRYIELTMPQLEALMSALEQNVPQLAEVLSLELPGHVSYSTVLLDAHRRLSEVTDQATAELLVPARRPSELFHFGVSHAEDDLDDAEHPGGTRKNSPHLEGKMLSLHLLSDEKGHFRPISEDSLPVLETCPWSTREALIGRVGAAVARCRQARSSLSLMLVELDDLENVTLVAGVDGAPRLVQQLGVAIQRIADTDIYLSQIGDARFTLILDDCDRRRAVDLAWHIVDGIRAWSHYDAARLRVALSVSIGLATLAMPPRNFPAEELLTAAERCLSGVQLSGGDGVKSIDIY